MTNNIKELNEEYFKLRDAMKTNKNMTFVNIVAEEELDKESALELVTERMFKFKTKLLLPKVVQRGNLYFVTNGHVRIPKESVEFFKNMGCIVKERPEKDFYSLKIIVDSDVAFYSTKSLHDHYNRYGMYIIKFTFLPNQKLNKYTAICSTYGKI